MSHPSNDLVVVDVETTGTNPFRHQLTAAAFVSFDNDNALELYVKPEHAVWSEFAKQQFTKYATKWATNAVSPSVACDAIEAYLALHYPQRKVTLIGHNIGFDVAFLRQLAFAGGRDELRGISHRVIDTHTLLYVLFKQGRIPSSALTSDGAFEHFDIRISESLRHTAYGDAVATKQLAEKVFDMLNSSILSRGIDMLRLGRRKIELG